MTIKFVQDGDVLDYPAGANITVGQVVLIGVRIGVALAAIANGATGPLAVKGVFNITKLGTDVVAMGALLYWDNANSRLTTTSAGNTLAGYAAAAAGSGVSLIPCHINA